MAQQLDSKQALREMIDQAYIAKQNDKWANALVGGGGLGVGVFAQQGTVSTFTPRYMKEAIASRLRISPEANMPFHFIECCKLEDHVAVFVVTNEDSKPVTILDGVDLFPSDTLVTQLRLLIK